MKFLGQTPRQFFTSKSNWTGITAITTAVTAWANGAIDTAIMIQSVFGGIAVICIKDAVAKK